MDMDIDMAIATLADPVRRQVVELLAIEPLRTNQLAERIGVSVPALSRHLRVLRDRAVVQRRDVEGDARGRQYELHPDVGNELSGWLAANRWSATLATKGADPDTSEFLGRVGGFLDGFAESDRGFFERHLSDDVELYFPGSAQPWGKAATVDSVAGHPPYVEWDIHTASVRALAEQLTIVAIEVAVRTSATAEAAIVLQTMIFDDASTPWTLRFLQQSAIA